MAEEYFVKSTSSLKISSEILPSSGRESSGDCGASASALKAQVTTASSKNTKQRMAAPREDKHAGTKRSIQPRALIQRKPEI